MMARNKKLPVDELGVGELTSGTLSVGGLKVDESSVAANCGCGCGVVDDTRHAVGVDPGIKARNVKRLRRIEGQVRGLQKMVDDDRYCADIMTQISSVQEALRSVSRELMRNHLKHCAASAIRAGESEADAMYDELVDLMFKHNR